MPNLHFIRGAFAFLRNLEWIANFIIQVKSYKPDLIVVDTFSRFFGAGEENTSEAMGAAIEGINQILAATGASVLVVHHSGKASDASGPRGHSSLAGTASTVMRLSRGKNSELHVLVCEHQRDDEEFQDIAFRLSPASNSRIVSLVNVPAAAASHGLNQSTIAEAAMLQTLSDSGPQTHAALINAAKAAGVGDSTANRVLKALCDGGSVTKHDKLYSLGAIEGLAAA